MSGPPKIITLQDAPTPHRKDVRRAREDEGVDDLVKVRDGDRYLRVTRDDTASRLKGMWTLWCKAKGVSFTDVLLINDVIGGPGIHDPGNRGGAMGSQDGRCHIRKRNCPLHRRLQVRVIECRVILHVLQGNVPLRVLGHDAKMKEITPDRDQAPEGGRAIQDVKIVGIVDMSTMRPMAK